MKKFNPGEDAVGLAGVLDDISLPSVNPSSLDFLSAAPAQKDIFEEHKRKGWDKTTEARCDFSFKLRLTRRSNICFVSIWQKTLYGRTLTEIKADDDMVPFFAQNIAPVIKDILGEHLDLGSWAIVTTPKRRHLTKNFATRIAENMAMLLNVPFYEDVAFCRTKQRMNAVFDLNILPAEPNIIVFDDFVTTGQTLHSMAVLLRQYNKNLVFFTGINNKL